MKNYRVLVSFVDRVTGEVYEADTEIALSDERAAEVKAFNPNFISLVEKKPKSNRKK